MTYIGIIKSYTSSKQKLLPLSFQGTCYCFTSTPGCQVLLLCAIFWKLHWETDKNVFLIYNIYLPLPCVAWKASKFLVTC